MRVLLTLVLWITFTAVAVAPPPLVDGADPVWRALQYMSIKDVNAALAERFPSVPAAQRHLVGDIPSRLWPLVAGADHRGRLILSAPPPGHAMLLAKPSFAGDAALLDASATGPPTWTQPVLRGIGIVTDRTGKVHFFHTSPFLAPNPSHFLHPRPSPARPSTLPSGEIHMLVPATGEHLRMFRTRKISLILPGLSRYDSGETVKLGQIAVLPLTNSRVSESDVRSAVYPSTLLQQVLTPNFADQGAASMRESVEWSDYPNWSSKDREAAKKIEKQRLKQMQITRVDQSGSSSRSHFFKWLSFGKESSSPSSASSSASSPFSREE